MLADFSGNRRQAETRRLSAFGFYMDPKYKRMIKNRLENGYEI